jgi:hypothetical protein
MLAQAISQLSTSYTAYYSPFTYNDRAIYIISLVVLVLILRGLSASVLIPTCHFVRPSAMWYKNEADLAWNSNGYTGLARGIYFPFLVRRISVE